MIAKRVDYQYFQGGVERSFSTSNIEYFNEFATYCKQNGINLIILQTPMHEVYEGRVPQKFKDQFFSLIKDNDLELIDFRNLHLEDEDFLPDGDHVARKGSILISQFLKDSEKIH